MNPQFALHHSNRSALIFLASLLVAVVLYPGLQRALERWMPNTNLSSYGNSRSQQAEQSQWGLQTMWR
jgi:hypothetical protein